MRLAPRCRRNHRPRTFSAESLLGSVFLAAERHLQDIQNESGRHNDLRGHKASLVAAQRDSRRRVRLVRRVVVGKLASSVLPHACLRFCSCRKRTEINREDVEMLIDLLSSRLSDFKEEGREMIHNEESHYCEYCVVLDPPIVAY